MAETYQGKLTAEQLSAMKAGATQSLDDMVDAVKQLPEVAAFAASHPVLFGKAMAKAYTQMLTDNQRDTGEMLALRMMGKNEEAQQVGAKHVGEMLTNIALGLGGEAAATKALEAIGKVTKTVKGALPVVDNTSLPKYTGGNGSAVVEGEFAGQSSAQGVIGKTAGNDLSNDYVQNSPVDFNHILKADYTKKGKPTGGHTLLYGDVRIVSGTESKPDISGVYKATIQVPDPANPEQWITKTSNKSTNSMFPKDWDETRVKVEVDAAWNSPNKIVDGDFWSSTTPSGVKVEGYISPRTTVYPVYQESIK
ncbi:hypothetical protein BSQ33_19200 [Vibrio gazogenes]|uniref:Bacterial EndoU nuclease domain-containing protein n=1 Tax=Vibrio gazogenes TaxID=687 RepID=A0A1Z2SKX1_VIBGA|nr:hypothetical protein BSQ33_19200 [Vibrio gazogenes]